MSGDDREVLSNVIKIDDERIRGHLDRIVRGTVEETLNALLDAEADRLVGAGRYEHGGPVDHESGLQRFLPKGNPQPHLPLQKLTYLA